ncbi:SdrD B-like domain-containing protein, partial [Olleya namhaensis]|uniref:SdrD B-like domain-containing protein n=1 Tax=Olleya namhaensis TaxID=1144750 RepID=UPI00233038BF
VFEDINGDGVQDPGEEGIAGVDVTITDVDGNETTVTTDADGIWEATDIPVGDTVVDVDETTLPAEITNTLTTTDSDPETVTVLEGDNPTTNDGFVPVDMDSDGDGVLDSVEVTNGTNPNDACEYNVADITEVITATTDCDMDGLT